MEVTQSNFEEALGKLKSTLKSAEFISIDGEFTGLGYSYGERYNELDTPEQRYQKARKVVTNYGLIQLGVSIFRFCEKTKKYFTSTYSFFLSGNPNGSYRYDSSSMGFLAENDFDFNKLFMEGLPFISLNEEAEKRRGRSARLVEEKQVVSPLKIKDDRSRQFAQEATKKFSKLNDENRNCIFKFSEMTGFHRKLLFNNVSPNFPTCKLSSNKERDLEVTFFNSEEEKMQSEDDEWERELNRKIGFNHVIKAFLEADKPIIGHNSFLDILHLVDKFLVPLPETLEEFKSVVKSNMPSFYDTKLIVQDPPFSTNILNTSLGLLYEDLLVNYSPPTFATEEGLSSYTIKESGQPHDGGYDAFMTGVCFATLLKHFERGNWSTTSSPIKTKGLKPYENKVNLMASYDIPFIDLNADEALSDRSYIYCVNCPSSFKQNDVRNLFGKLRSYKSVWVSEKFFYIIPQEDSDISQVKFLLQGIRASCPFNVSVTMYGTAQDDAANDSDSSIEILSDFQAEPINLKRKSNDFNKEEPQKEPEKTLKRLKSVGTEKLSQLSLEPPSVEDSGKSNSSKESKKSKEVFDVPDDW